MSFREKWLEAVKKKNSVLCAGLDPAEYEMEKGEKGLSDGTDKLGWAIDYIEAVAPYCAAIKPNIQFWKNLQDMEALYDISNLAKELNLVVIDDSKLADLDSTNEAGMYFAKQRADAVTLAPFAGNMGEAAKQAKKFDIGLITMCLMSNPKYEREKDKWVAVEGYEFGDNYKDSYKDSDVKGIHVRQYIQLAHDANAFGLDGIVIGAPSAKNHIKEKEIEKVRSYVSNEMLVLLIGVGAQGGKADIIWEYFDKDNVIVNVGRSLMFPNGSESTIEEQEAKAKEYKNKFNYLREKTA